MALAWLWLRALDLSSACGNMRPGPVSQVAPPPLSVSYWRFLFAGDAHDFSEIVFKLIFAVKFAQLAGEFFQMAGPPTAELGIVF